jgi:short-subunit dehydrogenase
VDLIEWAGDLWVRRRAEPAPEALARIADLTPATVVTGASQGLGFELARRMAKEKRAVVLLARSEASLAVAAADLRVRYPAAIVVAEALDVAEPDAFEQIEALLARHNLYLDVLVNNAAIALTGQYTVQDPQAIDELIGTNISALSRLTRLALPAMRARGRGGILNLSSLGSFTPGPWSAAYFASKAYVLSLTAALAAECSGEGVRLCTIAFGPIRTQMLDDLGGSHTYYKMLLPAASPARMARLAWRAYRLGRRVVVPGLIYNILAWFMRAMPYELLLPIVGWLMRPRVPGKLPAALRNNHAP